VQLCFLACKPRQGTSEGYRFWPQPIQKARGGVRPIQFVAKSTVFNDVKYQYENLPFQLI